MTRTLAALALALCAAVLPPQVAAQAWPSRPILFVCPFSAGSPPDVVSRVLAKALSESSLGQRVVVDTRLGAGGNIAAEQVAKAAPDGHTIMLGSTAALAINPSLYAKLPYSPSDFVPIILAATAPYFVFASPDLPGSSLKDLVALAKAKPGALSFGSTGSGTPLHIAGEMFKAANQLDIVHVPYKTIGALATDLSTGRLQLAFAQWSGFAGQVKAGKMKVLAVAAARRDPYAPDVPTTREAGYGGFEVSSWFGVVAPRGTPQDIVERLNAEMNKALAQDEVRQSLNRLNIEPVGGSPKDFAAHIAAEAVKWANAVKTSGAKVE